MSKSVVADSIWSLRPVGGPQMSYDGKYIVWVEEEADVKENRMRSRLWVANSDGSNRRPLTGPGHKDRLPVWSPVNYQLAFISDRSGDDRIWLINACGGEADIIDMECRPMASPAWSPDGKKIAFSAGIEAVPSHKLPYPGSPEFPDKEDGPERKERPIVITDSTFKLDGVGLFGSTSVQIAVVDARPTGKGKANVTFLTQSRGKYLNPAWSPDGSKIACTAITDPDAIPLDGRLWIIDVDSKQGQLALEGDRPVGGMCWSPDSSKIAFMATEQIDWGTSGTDLYLIDVSGELPVAADKVRCLTYEFDRVVGGTTQSDTRHFTGEFSVPIHWFEQLIYCTIMSEGATHVYAVDPDTGDVTQLSTGDDRLIGGFSIAPNHLAYVASRSHEPDEIYVLSEGKEQQISAANSDAGFDWIAPERLLFKGADDWDIEGWLLKPAGDMKGCILSIHGGPSGMYGYGFMFLFQLLAHNGYAVMYCNPRGSQGYGRDFAYAVRHDWGGKDYQDLMAAVDVAIKETNCPPDRLGVMGWSYGGFMTNWISGHNDRFRAGVSGACVSDMASMVGPSDIGAPFTEFSIGGVPWDESYEVVREHSPLSYAHNVKTPLLFLHGEADIRCPVAQSEMMYTALKAQGVDTVLVRYPDEFHGLGRPFNRADRFRRTLSWFDHYIAGE